MRESSVNFLLISDDTKQHYCSIKDIIKLLSLQTSKHDHARHVCFRCLNTFNYSKSLASNREYCKSYGAAKIEHHEEISKIFFLKITTGQCESHLLYMQSLSPSHHSYQPANLTLRRATQISIRNTSPADFVST